MTLEEMKAKLQELKDTARDLLNSNKVKDADKIANEAEILELKIQTAEVQAKLDTVTLENEMVKNELNTTKESLSKITEEKNEVLKKYEEATNTVVELQSKVSDMQPIVDAHIQSEKQRKEDEALDFYKAKFEKVDALDRFESNEIKDLILKTVDENKEIANEAKYALSNEIMNLIDNVVSAKSLPQEPANNIKINIQDEDEEFEKFYGFSRK